MEKFVCKFCDKKYTRPYSLKVHLNTSCIVFAQKKREEEDAFTALKLRVEELECENAFLRERLADAEKRELLEAKERAQKLENHILKESSKPRTNITMNLAPYCSTEELVEICEQYTVDHFIEGPEATYRFLLENCLKKDGVPRVKCTDPSRRVFRGVKNGEPFIDIGGKKITTDVSKPLKSAIKVVSNKVDDLEDYDWAKKTSSHYRALESSRLSKRLVQDFTGG